MYRMLSALLALTWASPALAQQCEFPGVLLVLDRSISMNATIDGEKKWDIATGAVSSMLADHGDAAHFGLMVYPGPSGDGAAGVVGPVGACDFNRVDQGCEPLAPRCSTGEVMVDIGGGNQQQILDALVWPEGLRHSYTQLRGPGHRRLPVLRPGGGRQRRPQLRRALRPAGH